MVESPRRVVLLGASNVRRSLATAVGVSRAKFGDPLEIVAAMGHGRSYGRPSTVLARTLPGIVGCGLWEHLQQEPKLPTVAVVTDIGNDLLYGSEVTQIVDWVEQCVTRLLALEASVVMAALPLESLRKVRPWQFQLLCRALFPKFRGNFLETFSDAQQLDEQLFSMAQTLKLPRVDQPETWFGFDPIHARRRHWPAMWRRFLSPLSELNSASEFGDKTSKTSGSKAISCVGLGRLRPHAQRFFGRARSQTQPCTHLQSGTTIAWF